MSRLHIEAHCLDDETAARFERDHAVKVLDASHAPWSVVFGGAEEDLRAFWWAEYGLPNGYSKDEFPGVEVAS